MAIPRFESLIEDHHDEIYNYLWRLARSARATEPAVLAEDLTQDTFLRAYKAYGRLAPDSNVRAWLYKIATNRARSDFRRKKEQRLDDQLLTAASGESARNAVEERTILRQRANRMHSALAALPFKQQTAITLRHLEGLAYAQVAEVLACSQESARANVYQGLRQLRRVLDAEEMSL